MTQYKLFKPLIKLNRLVITKGNQVVYDQSFHSGVNILYGKNGHGKSTVLDLIFYALGGALKEDEWREEALSCEYVIAEITVNSSIFTLRREVSNTIQNPMYIYYGDLPSALSKSFEYWEKYPYSYKNDKVSFSKILFDALGLPDIKSVDVDSRITMNEFLRLVYSDQKTPFFEIFRNELWDSDLKRKLIGELHCGVHNTDFYRLNKELKEVSTEYASISNYLKNIGKLLADEKHLNSPEFFEKYLINTQKELEEKYNSINELKENIFSEKYASEVNKIAKTELKRLNAELGQVSEILLAKNELLNKLEFAIVDSEMFLTSLRTKLSEIHESETTAQALGDIIISHCPACLSKISNFDTDNKCYLCHSDVTDRGQKINLAKIKHNLTFQLTESQKLQQQREVDCQDLQKEIQQLNRKKLNLQKEYSEKMRGYSSYETAIFKKEQEIGYLQRTLEDIEKKHSLSLTIKDHYAKKQELSGKITDLKDRIERIENENKKGLREAVGLIIQNMKDFLAQDIGTEDDLKSAQNITVNFTKNRISIEDRQNFAASSMNYSKNCFHLALWKSSMEKSSFNFPRFLLLDNIEDKGIEDDRIHNFQKMLKICSDNAKIEHQIIFTSSKLAKELNRAEFIIGHYYHADENDKTLNLNSPLKIEDIIRLSREKSEQIARIDK